MDQHSDDERNQQMRRMMGLAQIGFEMVAPVVVGVLLDRWQDWTPWATIVGVILGFGLGFVRLWRIAQGGVR